MHLKDQNCCNYCEEPAVDEQNNDIELMICEPCGLIKYCNESCQYDDSYRHNDLCMTVKKYLKEWLFFQTMSLDYQESPEHEFDGLRALGELIKVCHQEMTATHSKLAGERTLEFCQELQFEHERLCRKYEVSGFSAFYQIFDTYLSLGMYDEAKDYMKHPLTFGFGQHDQMANFCLSMIDLNQAKPSERNEILQDTCAKMKLAIWEMMIHTSPDKRPGKEIMPLVLQKIKRKYNCNLILYFFNKIEALKAEGKNKKVRENWKKLTQTVNHADLQRKVFAEIDAEMELVDWEGTWILDLTML